MFAPQYPAHRIDGALGQAGEVGVGFLFRFAVLVSVAGAHQDGAVGFSISFGGDDIDMHWGIGGLHMLSTEVNGYMFTYYT